jgi:hypothetical protein
VKRVAVRPGKEVRTSCLAAHKLLQSLTVVKRFVRGCKTLVKVAVLSFRIQDDTKSAVEAAAKGDDRSVSSLVERILRAWLIDKGYLPRDAGD